MINYRHAIKAPLILSLLYSMSVFSVEKNCEQIVAEASSVQAQAVQAKPLILVDKGTLSYMGLTEEGKASIKLARDTVRSRERLFENEMRGLTSIHHAGMVARLYKGNMFLYGPPGGAKSMFVNWMMKGEPEVPYKLQLHQMITEQAFTGGQNFEAAKLGQFEINTKGSLADYSIALLDEAEKGNPAALASLLSLLNEREILAGNKVIKARLETLFATSNANLPEIFQQFLENGQGSTAPALLNRFQIKAFVYNWLHEYDQGMLDARRAQSRFLKALGTDYPELMAGELFLAPEKLNWKEMRQLANTIFTLSDEAMSVYRDFVGLMREKTNRAVRESEQRHLDNPMDEPFVYFPSADYTERLRQQIPEMIIMSAFIDLLESPALDDKLLDATVGKRIELDAYSLWRGYLAMTTVGPGEIKLVRKIVKDADGSDVEKLEIDFGANKLDPSKARDKREEQLIKNLQDEQVRFAETYSKVIEDYQKSLKQGARFNRPELQSGNPTQGVSFEKMLLKARGDI